MLVKRQGNTFKSGQYITIVSTQNVMKEKRSLDALSLNVSEKVFAEHLDIAKSYEKNSDFIRFQDFLKKQEEQKKEEPAKKKKKQ